VVVLFSATATVLVTKGGVDEGVGTFEPGIAKGGFLEIMEFGNLRFDERGGRGTLRSFNFGVFL
jgi:hypothetical protein